MIHAWREGFRVLAAIGTPITPAKLKVLKRISEPLQVALWRRVLDTKFAEIVATRHANAARDEMKQLADEFMELRHLSSVRTPVVPPDWRSVGTKLGALVVRLSLALVWARRG